MPSPLRLFSVRLMPAKQRAALLALSLVVAVLALTRILVGMADAYTGLDTESFQVVADFAIDGVAAGQDLAAKFQPLPDNRWELKLGTPIASLAKGKLTVSVKDRQGNLSRIERAFSVADAGQK